MTELHTTEHTIRFPLRKGRRRARVELGKDNHYPESNGRTPSAK